MFLRTVISAHFGTTIAARPAAFFTASLAPCTADPTAVSRIKALISDAHQDDTGGHDPTYCPGCATTVAAVGRRRRTPDQRAAADLRQSIARRAGAGVGATQANDFLPRRT